LIVEEAMSELGAVVADELNDALVILVSEGQARAAVDAEHRVARL
jgi:hypothetical protein